MYTKKKKKKKCIYQEFRLKHFFQIFWAFKLFLSFFLFSLFPFPLSLFEMEEIYRWWGCRNHFKCIPIDFARTWKRTPQSGACLRSSARDKNIKTAVLAFKIPDPIRFISQDAVTPTWNTCTVSDLQHHYSGAARNLPFLFPSTSLHWLVPPKKKNIERTKLAQNWKLYK